MTATSVTRPAATETVCVPLRIGGRLRRLRTERGMSIQTLAESASIPPEQLASMEINTASPSAYQLLKLADTLRVSLDELVGRRFEKDDGYTVIRYEHDEESAPKPLRTGGRKYGRKKKRVKKCREKRRATATTLSASTNATPTRNA